MGLRTFFRGRAESSSCKFHFPDSFSLKYMPRCHIWGPCVLKPLTSLSCGRSLTTQHVSIYTLLQLTRSVPFTFICKKDRYKVNKRSTPDAVEMLGYKTEMLLTGPLAIKGSGRRPASQSSFIHTLENSHLSISLQLIVLGSKHSWLCPPAPLLWGQNKHFP